MSLEYIDPNEIELRIAVDGEVLSRCPFCGGYAHMSSWVNHKTFSGRTLYQAKIVCQSVECMATIFSNSHQRGRAQAQAVRKWSARAKHQIEDAA